MLLITIIGALEVKCKTTGYKNVTCNMLPWSQGLDMVLFMVEDTRPHDSSDDMLIRRLLYVERAPE